MKFIHLLCARLRWTSEQVEHVILQDLPARLANLLIGLAAKHEPADVGRPFLVTQQEIGEMVGVTRESINKQLRAWSLKGWIRLEPGSIAVLKPKALAAVAEAEPATLDEPGSPLKV
jgi:CRP-like cAMP-binding protein